MTATPAPHAADDEPDPNSGVVHGRLGRGAIPAALAAAAVTIGLVVALALRIGAH